MKIKFNVFLIFLTVFNVFLLIFRTYSERKQPLLNEKKINNEDIYINLSFTALIDDGKIIKEKVKIDKPVFCMRFSFINCNDCVQNALVSLKKWAKKPNIVEGIMIYGTFFSDRDFKIFQNENLSFRHIYNVDRNFLDLPLEENTTTPFFFMLFPDGSVHHVFIPIKENSERTYRYLEIIKQKYFEKN